jgi:hypothetical protein
MNISIDKLNTVDKNKIVNLEKQDIHLSLMRKCSNLLLHKGGFSILGGILFQGNNLYISARLETRNNSDYMGHLEAKNIVLL